MWDNNVIILVSTNTLWEYVGLTSHMSQWIRGVHMTFFQHMIHGTCCYKLEITPQGALWYIGDSQIGI